MDSRGAFSALLIITGFVGIYFAWTGKFAAVWKAATGAPPAAGFVADPGQAGTSAAAGGSYGSSTSTTGNAGGTPTPPAPSTNAVSVGGMVFNIPGGAITTPPFTIPIAGSDGLAISPFGSSPSTAAIPNSATPGISSVQ